MQQSFTDFGVNVSAAFNAEIPINGTLRVNNELLARYGVQQVLGPFSVNGNILSLIHISEPTRPY